MFEVNRSESLLKAVAPSFIEAPRYIGGVYVLLSGVEVYYVGQSVDIWQRIQTHMYSKKMSYFDRFYFVLIKSTQDRSAVERTLVAMFQPRENVALKGRVSRREWEMKLKPACERAGLDSDRIEAALSAIPFHGFKNEVVV